MTTNATFTIAELAERARDARARARALTGKAIGIVAKARAEQRTIDGRLEYDAAAKSRLRGAVREAARQELVMLDVDLKIAGRELAEFVEAASVAPAGGGTDVELRRTRAATAINQVLAGQRTTAEKGTVFRQLVEIAEAKADLVSLETLREMRPYLAAGGVDGGPDLPARLDRAAGPPAARLAREWETEAIGGTNWTGNAIGTARHALDEPHDQELGLLAADWDRNIMSVDSWKPDRANA